jgi:hypothetical protein
MPPGAIEELAYNTALTALSNQDGELNQLRSRTGTLLAAASITASFFGVQALSRQASGTFSVVALIASVLALVLCIYVLAPKTGISFSLSGTVLYRELAEEVNLPAAHLKLVEWLEGLWGSNQGEIDKLARFFAAASLALTVAIICWAVALGGTL